MVNQEIHARLEELAEALRRRYPGLDIKAYIQTTCAGESPFRTISFPGSVDTVLRLDLATLHGDELTYHDGFGAIGMGDVQSDGSAFLCHRLRVEGEPRVVALRKVPNKRVEREVERTCRRLVKVVRQTTQRRDPRPSAARGTDHARRRGDTRGLQTRPDLPSGDRRRAFVAQHRRHRARHRRHRARHRRGAQRASEDCRGVARVTPKQKTRRKAGSLFQRVRRLF